MQTHDKVWKRRRINYTRAKRIFSCTAIASANCLDLIAGARPCMYPTSSSQFFNASLIMLSRLKKAGRAHV